MTRIDFYITPGDEIARQRLACRIVEKAHTMGHKIYIHTHDAATAKQFDQTLWTFHDLSFIPHTLVSDTTTGEETTTVHIGFGAEPNQHDEVLINLTTEVPPFFSRFQRVAEMIGGDDEQKKAGRERYRFYRDRGYPLEVHNL